MTFDFDQITVGELDEAFKSSRFSDEMRQFLAKITGQTVEEVTALPVPAYKKLVANFVKAAYSPVEADPN